MKQITDYTQLKKLLNSYSYKLSNNYILPQALTKLIEKRRLLFESDEQGAYIFELRHGYLKLYFHLNSNNAKLPSIIDTVAASVVRRNGKPDSETADWLIAQGFKLSATRIHLVAQRLNVADSACVTTGATGHEAYEFFARHFNPIISDLPIEEDYGCLIATRNENAAITGLIHADEPFCIAVDDSARRQGVATKLFAAYQLYNSGFTPPRRFKLWADQQNAAALGLYKKLGFKQDGLYSECYIKKGRNYG